MVFGSCRSSVNKLLNTNTCLAYQNLEGGDFLIIERERDFESKAMQMCRIVP